MTPITFEHHPALDPAQDQDTSVVMRLLRLLCVFVLATAFAVAQGFRSIVMVPTTHRRRLGRLSAYRATIRMVGRKQNDSWITDGCGMYEKRLRSAGWDIDTVYHKTDAVLEQGVATDVSKRIPIVLLDIEEGKSYTSESFASSLYNWIEEGGSRVSFVIGGGECCFVCFSPSRLTATNKQRKGFHPA